MSWLPGQGWTCPNPACGRFNPRWRFVCRVCKAERPGDSIALCSMLRRLLRLGDAR
ncbi:hypothetical protein [Streptomyces synnematoformans]|uniref:RanBP2-type domain-containing protein n=1 Tax=Streptomyces synnematoformans TaxID=415721 RepID=A0ABP5IW75_9ACTN